MQKIDFKIRQPDKKLHSRNHILAKEISDYCGEPKKFALFLGIIRNVGFAVAFENFSKTKQLKNIRNRGATFLYFYKEFLYQKNKKEKCQKIKN